MEENLQEESAKMHKRKWICFGIVTAVVVALIGVCIGMSYVFDKNGVTLDHNTGIAWLAIAGTLLGCHVLFLTVHTLSYYHTVPIKILKTVLRVGALVLMAVIDTLSLVFMSSTAEVDPWVMGLLGAGFFGAVNTTLTFYWNERVMTPPRGTDFHEFMEENISRIERSMTVKKGYPFIPFAALLLGYLISVAFAYLGKNVHSFFYGWFGVILCIIAIIISVVIFVKKYTRRKNRRGYSSGGNLSSGNGSSDNIISDDTPRKADENHKEGYRRMNRVVNSSDSLLPYSLPVGVSRVEWSKGANIVNYNNWAGRDSIIFGGRIKCFINKEQRDYADDLCKRVLDAVKDNIGNEAESVLRDLKSEFSNYGDYTVRYSLEYTYTIV